MIIKIDITIPVFYTNEVQIEDKKIDYINNEIRTKFNNLVIDEFSYYNRIYTTIGPDNQDTRTWLTKLKQTLTTQLKQDISIILSKCEII